MRWVNYAWLFVIYAYRWSVEVFPCNFVETLPLFFRSHVGSPIFSRLRFTGIHKTYERFTTTRVNPLKNTRQIKFKR